MMVSAIKIVHPRCQGIGFGSRTKTKNNLFDIRTLHDKFAKWLVYFAYSDTNMKLKHKNNQLDRTIPQ
jgi:hypothetical protein